MPRSVWKGAFVDAFLMKILAKKKTHTLMNKKIWSRRSTILPEFVGKNVLLHNGYNFARCKITEDKIGHKFGEFASTRQKQGFSRLEKRKNVQRRHLGPVKKKAKVQGPKSGKQDGTKQSRKMSTGVTCGLGEALIHENKPHIAFQTASMKHGCVYGIQLDPRYGLRF